jgi:acetyltransferase-like isoleucine patch superfamily enzyme
MLYLKLVKRALKWYRWTFWSAAKYARFVGVKIGDDCSIATKYFGSEPYLVTIGNHVQVTLGVRFSTHGGGWVFRNKYADFDTFGKITVGDNVYIGNCSLILAGVTIGNNVIIGAGSVVTKSIPDNVIVAGNPAKYIGSVSDLEIKLVRFNVGIKNLSPKKKMIFLLNLGDDHFIKKPVLATEKKL